MRTAATLLAALSLGALVLAASPARAAGLPDATYHALPCRPTIACTADLVPPGSIEVETGYLRRATPAGDGHSVPLLFKLSLLEDLQLQLGTNTAYVRADGGGRSFDDGFGGLKVRLAQQTARLPALGVSLLADAVAIPSLDRTGYGALFTAYATKDLAWLHADLNVGANRWWAAGAHATQPFAALALSTELGRGFGVMAEGYVFGDAAFVQPKDAGFLSALTWAPAPYVIFDAGSDVALFPSTRTLGLFVGTTLIVFDLWDEVRARASESAGARRPRPLSLR